MVAGVALGFEFDRFLRTVVGHAADHAHGAPAAVADQEATVQHPRIGAVLAAKAVGVRPVAVGSVDGRVDALEHRFAVLGMQPQRPGGAVRWQLVERHAEQALHAFVPPHGVGGEVPVPDRIGRGARDELEALFAALQRQIGLVARRDVLEGPLDADYPALRIAHRLAGGAHPTMPLARHDDLGLQVEGGAVPQAGLECIAQCAAVRWRVEVQDLAHGTHPPGQPVRGGDFLRPAQPHAGQLHDPATHLCDAAGHAQRLSLLHQLVVHAVALLHQLCQQALLAAQLQLHHGLLGQHREAIELLGLQGAHAGVQHRQRAQGKAFAIDQWNTGVKADVRAAGHQRVVREHGVRAGIAHHHRLLAAVQCVGTERDGAVGLLERDAHGGLEPLALAVHKIDHRHRRAADARGQHGQLVEGILGRGVQDGVGLQCMEPRSLSGGVLWMLHDQARESVRGGEVLAGNGVASMKERARTGFDGEEEGGKKGAAKHAPLRAWGAWPPVSRRKW